MVHPPTSSWARVIEIAGAFACAVVSYHFLENPIRHSKRLDRDGRRGRADVVDLRRLFVGRDAAWSGTWAHVS